jgi:hypothetical protein
VTSHALCVPELVTAEEDKCVDKALTSIHVSKLRLSMPMAADDHIMMCYNTILRAK